MMLFIDDLRFPEECSKYMHNRIGKLNPIYLEEWTIVRNYKDFCNKIVENFEIITHISFDHDLADCFQLKESLNIDEWFDLDGNREYTGYDCAVFVENWYRYNDKKLPTIFVHSANPVGTEKIIKLFK